MITFKDFLVEAEAQDFVAFLKEHCQQAVSDIIKSDRFLWRGMVSKAPAKTWVGHGKEFKATINQVRKDREPLNTPSWAQRAIDDWFEKKLGVRPRSSAVFAFNDDGPAELYGKLHIIIPVGDYKLIWSPEVLDLTVKLFPDIELASEFSADFYVGGANFWIKQKGGLLGLDEVTQEEQVEELHRRLDKLNYTDDDNVGGYGHKGELMVLGSQYLAIDLEAEDLAAYFIKSLIYEVAA